MSAPHRRRDRSVRGRLSLRLAQRRISPPTVSTWARSRRAGRHSMRWKRGANGPQRASRSPRPDLRRHPVGCGILPDRARTDWGCCPSPRRRRELQQPEPRQPPSHSLRHGSSAPTGRHPDRAETPGRSGQDRVPPPSPPQPTARCEIGPLRRIQGRASPIRRDARWPRREGGRLSRRGVRVCLC